MRLSLDKAPGLYLGGLGGEPRPGLGRQCADRHECGVGRFGIEVPQPSSLVLPVNDVKEGAKELAEQVRLEAQARILAQINACRGDRAKFTAAQISLGSMRNEPLNSFGTTTYRFSPKMYVNEFAGMTIVVTIRDGSTDELEFGLESTDLVAKNLLEVFNLVCRSIRGELEYDKLLDHVAKQKIAECAIHAIGPVHQSTASVAVNEKPYIAEDETGGYRLCYSATIRYKNLHGGSDLERVVEVGYQNGKATLLAQPEDTCQAHWEHRAQGAHNEHSLDSSMERLVIEEEQAPVEQENLRRFARAQELRIFRNFDANTGQDGRALTRFDTQSFEVSAIGDALLQQEIIVDLTFLKSEKSRWRRASLLLVNARGREFRVPMYKEFDELFEWRRIGKEFVVSSQFTLGELLERAPEKLKPDLQRFINDDPEGQWQLSFESSSSGNIDLEEGRVRVSRDEAAVFSGDALSLSATGTASTKIQVECPDDFGSQWTRDGHLVSGPFLSVDVDSEASLRRLQQGKTVMMVEASGRDEPILVDPHLWRFYSREQGFRAEVDLSSIIRNPGGKNRNLVWGAMIDSGDWTISAEHQPKIGYSEVLANPRIAFKQAPADANAMGRYNGAVKLDNEFSDKAKTKIFRQTVMTDAGPVVVETRSASARPRQEVSTMKWEDFPELIEDRISTHQHSAVDAQSNMIQVASAFASLVKEWPMPKRVRSLVDVDKKYNNAYYRGGKFHFGEGNGVDLGPMPSLDICAHEFMHWVTRLFSGLIYKRESGGLNEAYSDIFAMTVERLVHGDKWNPNIGEDPHSPSERGGALRYPMNPELNGKAVSQWSKDIKELDPHHSSGPLNLAFLLVALGGAHPRHPERQVLGISAALDDIEVSVAEAETAAVLLTFRFMYLALKHYLRPNSDYAETRRAVLAACDRFGLDVIKERYPELGAGRAKSLLESIRESFEQGFGAINVEDPGPDAADPCQVKTSPVFLERA